MCDIQVLYKAKILKFHVTTKELMFKVTYLEIGIRSLYLDLIRWNPLISNDS